MNKIKVMFVLVFGALVIFASPARATAILSGSNYGPLNTTLPPPPTSFTACESMTPCEAFESAGYLYDGYQVYLFTGGNNSLFDVVDFGSVGSMGAGATVELPVLSTSLAVGTGTGAAVFVCDIRTTTDPVTTMAYNLNTFASDSGNTQLTGLPCTQDALLGSVTQQSSIIDFKNTGTSTIPDLVLVTKDGNLISADETPTPEPSSLALLALGLIPMAFLSRRRLRA
jgi:hypothetical protein